MATSAITDSHKEALKVSQEARDAFVHAKIERSRPSRISCYYSQTAVQ